MIELTIVLALLLSGGVVWMQKKADERLRNQFPQIMKVLNQVVWEKYGQGNLEAYQQLFPEPRKRKATDSSPDDLSIILSSLPFNGDCGYAAIDAAPERFRSTVDGLEDFADRLHQVLALGPIIPSLDENIGSWPLLSIDSLAVRSHARGLKFLAFRDWMKDDRKSAVIRLVDVMRLGYAFRAIVDIGNLLVLLECIEDGLGGINSLLWNNPDGNSCRLLLQDLETLPLETLDLSKTFFNPTWEILKYVMSDNHSLANGLFAAEILQGQYEESVRNALWEVGVKSNSLNEWTTIPALKKRLEKLPDSFFESDPLFSIEQAKSLPRILYVASKANRSMSEKVFRFYSDRIENVIRKALAIQGALWARNWRDERGVWPTGEEFSIQCPVGDRFSLLTIEDPRPILLDVTNLFSSKLPNYSYISPNYSSEYHPKSIHFPDTRTIAFTFLEKYKTGPQETGEFISALPPINPPLEEEMWSTEGKSDSEIDEIAKIREEMQKTDWALGIFKAACPLIQSATYKITSLPIQVGGYEMMGMSGHGMMDMGMGGIYDVSGSMDSVLEYTIELKMPRQSVWIAECPDPTITPGIFLIETLMEDRQVGSQIDQKPIVQLAGWED